MVYFIKEIGCGVKGVCSMLCEDVGVLYGVMLDGCVFDLELGAILLVMCIKGESVDEIVGFMDVVEYFFVLLFLLLGLYVLVLIFSYNGARKLVNLMFLLVLLLVREGVLVLIYGV